MGAVVVAFGGEIEGGRGVKSSIGVGGDFRGIDSLFNAVQEESYGGGLGVDGADGALGDIVALSGGDGLVSDELVSAFEDGLDAGELDQIGVLCKEKTDENLKS